MSVDAPSSKSGYFPLPDSGILGYATAHLKQQFDWSSVALKDSSIQSPVGGKSLKSYRLRARISLLTKIDVIIPTRVRIVAPMAIEIVARAI